MKKNRFLWALLLLVSLGAAAQDNIHFVAGTPTQKGLSQKNMDALKLKVEQIIARNNAGTASLYNAFVIQPELVLGETKKTEGLLRDVTLVTGEFSLTARNKYDDSGDEAQGRAYTISRFSTELKNFLDEKLGGEYVASVVTMGQGLTVTIK